MYEPIVAIKMVIDQVSMNMHRAQTQKLLYASGQIVKEVMAHSHCRDNYPKCMTQKKGKLSDQKIKKILQIESFTNCGQGLASVVNHNHIAS